MEGLLTRRRRRPLFQWAMTKAGCRSDLFDEAVFVADGFATEKRRLNPGGDPVFVYFPFCLGSLIFRILGKVRIVGNCFLNAQNETRSLDLNATLQLFFKDGVTRGRHGKLVHRSLRPSGLIPVWATY
jgi:hypothetical protein